MIRSRLQSSALSKKEDESNSSNDDAPRRPIIPVKRSATVLRKPVASEESSSNSSEEVIQPVTVPIKRTPTVMKAPVFSEESSSNSSEEAVQSVTIPIKRTPILPQRSLTITKKNNKKNNSSNELSSINNSISPPATVATAVAPVTVAPVTVAPPAVAPVTNTSASPAVDLEEESINIPIENIELPIESIIQEPVIQPSISTKRVITLPSKTLKKKGVQWKNQLENVQYIEPIKNVYKNYKWKRIGNSNESNNSNSSNNSDSSNETSRSVESIESDLLSYNSNNSSQETVNSDSNSSQETVNSSSDSNSSQETVNSSNSNQETVNSSSDSNNSQESQEDMSIENNIYFSATNEELLEIWNTETDFNRRDVLIKILQKRNLFPTKGVYEFEQSSGAYPSLEDPNFLQRLMGRREFAESYQETWKKATDPCSSKTEEFEITPVQRFVSNFMSPTSPYNSMLLYHGVGVGKTCAAVQIAESWLRFFPRKKVIIIAQPNIQDGFMRTIFNADAVQIAEDEHEPNHVQGCTGNTYLELNGLLYEKDRAKLAYRAKQSIRRRYAFFGYREFANYVAKLIKEIPEKVKGEKRKQYEKTLLRREFSGHLIIVDEAHNLRDIPDEQATENLDAAAGRKEISDSTSGKILTPFMRKVLQYSEGVKLALLTATPMYNTYREIIFMLNLLLTNDKKATIREADIFDEDGDFVEGGEEKLEAIAQRYISFMRGENPQSFPLRLFPQEEENRMSLEQYPERNPRGAKFSSDELEFVENLPLVPSILNGASLKSVEQVMENLQGRGGLGYIDLERLISAANFSVPTVGRNSDEDASDKTPSDEIAETVNRNTLADHFKKVKAGKEVQYEAYEEDGAQWLAISELEQYAPKYVRAMRFIRRAEGVSFVYTRYVQAGALPFALALEAAGYTAYGRSAPLLKNGIQTRGGRQCALCELREKKHEGTTHEFTPAQYILLTGDKELSPNNDRMIKAATQAANVDGGIIKVVIGSEVASEGLDLKYIREIHLLDSWWHLNKTEQIIGRGIRFCSHSLLPTEKRNATVYLHVAILPEGATRESGDLYSYRIAYNKASAVGRVSRILKQAAIDCNLNRGATVIEGEPTIDLIDSQKQRRTEVNINDTPYTALCDWIETCEYRCKPEIAIDVEGSDTITYNEYAARWRTAQLKERLRRLFAKQSYYTINNILQVFADVPRVALVDLLQNMINNRLFRIVGPSGQDGYIIYRNGYLLFQPYIYPDLNIPLALRIGRIPVKRDEYAPIEMSEKDIEKQVNKEVKKELEEAKETQSAKDIYKETVRPWFKWINGLLETDRPYSEDLSTELSIRIDMQSNDDKKEIKRREERAEMIKWFIARAEVEDDVKKKILYSYVWDEELSYEEQKALLFDDETRARLEPYLGHNIVDIKSKRKGDITVYRIFNSQTNEVEYYCNGMETCPSSIVDLFKENNVSADPINDASINAEDTGELYGFLSLKKGNIVFKTSVPPVGKKKLGVGQECANVSNISDHKKKLLQLGELFEESLGTSHGLEESYIDEGKYRIVNSTRACHVLDLMLRLADEVGLNGQRWFYRTIESIKAGHKGKL